MTSWFVDSPKEFLENVIFLIVLLAVTYVFTIVLTFAILSGYRIGRRAANWLISPAP